MVYLEFDGPVFHPALSLPSDSARSPRLSAWITRPTERLRQGVYDTDEQSGTWLKDTIPGPEGVGEYIVGRHLSDNSGGHFRLEDTYWHLPQWQGGALLEYPLTPDSYIGIGGQVSTANSGIRWMLEGRLSTDLPAEAPNVRMSAGAFIGKHNLAAAFIRQVDGGTPLVSWAHGGMSTEGFFAEVVLGPPQRHAAVVPFLGITTVYQRLFTHGVPSPDPRFGTVVIREWFSLWTISPGLLIRLSSSTDLLISPRVVFDTSVDLTSPTSFALPLVQVNMRL